ncbi:hypothetical protein RRF57_011566 [Xylaria bambusicola]|uniref:Uncharacterized protein n=1 Tax=Xylaria bambusicola TaxID=326684 RepID=A0AAN7V4Q7_9PEZI
MLSAKSFDILCCYLGRRNAGTDCETFGRHAPADELADQGNLISNRLGVDIYQITCDTSPCRYVRSDFVYSRFERRRIMVAATGKFNVESGVDDGCDKVPGTAVGVIPAVIIGRALKILVSRVSR